jgi:hypothetical protein
VLEERLDSSIPLMATRSSKPTLVSLSVEILTIIAQIGRQDIVEGDDHLPLRLVCRRLDRVILPMVTKEYF